MKITEKKHRPIPFWSWNDKLNIAETEKQVQMMNEAGIGGFFMHARGGLETEYMGEEWFENVETAVSCAESNGMEAWIYDENGWPSGFGNGIINGMGERYQQKYLRYEKGVRKDAHTICNINGYSFYYEVNPFYVDNLDKNVVKKFIETVYEPYYKKFGNKIVGAFTDEPQLSRQGIPWSPVLPEEYKKRYGEEIYPILVELFENVGDFKNTRIKFWKLVTDLFCEAYTKQIYDWCVSHNWEFTGHMLLEETLESQITTNGAVMPNYEYFTMPGMDWLGKDIRNDGLTARQVGSVAAQMGTKRVLSECFAMCGHNVSFDELRRIVEWQMVRGVTTLCPHLEGYSLRGIRKRDYPPAMYYQQPWWNVYSDFIEQMSRIGMIMSDGEEKCDTLLIHPISAAWTCFNNGENEGLRELSDTFISALEELDKKHILYHLGDETIMERHSTVKNGKIVIGSQAYDKVILIDKENLLNSTKVLLNEYTEQGGIIETAERIKNNSIVDNPYITYTKRSFSGFDVHYFVNSTEKEQKARFTKGNKRINLGSGEPEDFCGEYTFEPYSSILLYDDGGLTKQEKKVNEILKTDGVWNIESCTENAITLDYCDVYFDDKLVGRNMYILSVQDMACGLEREVKIKCVFKQYIEYVPEDLQLVCETPHIFDILINGVLIDKSDRGSFIDNSFRRIDIAQYVHCGKNIIELICNFKQSTETYNNIKNAEIFESEKNKLTYDMEIEPVYLIGNFGVYADTTETVEENIFRTGTEFTLSKPPKEILLTEIEKQGYLFFAGTITVEKEFELYRTDYSLKIGKAGINAVQIEVNGLYVGTQIWNREEIDISKYLVQGSNKIKLTLINNLRNLLGPHHLQIGESHSVGPNSFYKESCLWNKNVEMEWNDEYCFIELSVY